jgi:SAM-dependent methyltransferase
VERDLTQLNNLWDKALAVQVAAPETPWHTKAAIECLEAWLPKMEGLGEHGVYYVLDVGCGTGFLRDYFEARNWWYYGLSLQEHANMRADYHFLEPKASYDLVFSRHVVEHSPMPYLAVTKLYEFTAPGGWCVIITPLPPSNADYPDHFSVMPRGSWCSLFRRVGFQIVDIADATVGDGSLEQRFLLKREVQP